MPLSFYVEPMFAHYTKILFVLAISPFYTKANDINQYERTWQKTVHLCNQHCDTPDTLEFCLTEMWQLEITEWELRGKEMKQTMSQVDETAIRENIPKKEAIEISLRHVRDFSARSIEKVGRVWDCFIYYNKQTQEVIKTSGMRGAKETVTAREANLHRCFYTEKHDNIIYAF